MSPLISIVVPVYNVEKYISECVESLVEQTYPNYEIILVDDGSTDGCPAICDGYEAKYKNVITVHQQNKGLSGARNTGIDKSHGDFIVFVDSDDRVSGDLLRTLYDLMTENDADIACASHIENGGVKVYSANEAVFHILKEDTGLTTSAWGKLFKKELFNDLRFPEGMVFEDYYTIPYVFGRAERIVHTDKALYYYRMNDESITHSQFSAKRLEYYYAAEHTGKLVSEKYPEYKKHAQNRDTRYSIAFYRQAAKSPERDKKSEKTLVKHVRRGILPYLFSGYKLTSKAYGVVIAVCPPLARKMF